MVDLLGMFRRRPAKRPAGFARSREDITALGDSFGDILSNPVRDAPPIARDGVAAVDLPPPAPAPARTPHPLSPGKAKPASSPAPRSKKANGGGPQLLRRPGFLAVHSVEKSFGTRQVVRGVSIYVRRGEAVGLLGPNALARRRCST